MTLEIVCGRRIGTGRGLCVRRMIMTSREEVLELFDQLHSLSFILSYWERYKTVRETSLLIL